MMRNLKHSANQGPLLAEFVMVMQPETDQTAIAIIDLLREAGIQTVAYPYARTYAGILFGESAQPAWGEILVRQADEEKALEMIGGFLGTLGMLEPEEPTADSDSRR